MTPHLNTPHLMRSLAAAIALLGLLAAPALAQRVPARGNPQSPEAAAPDPARPNAVMFGSKKIGQDPDPFIRNEMLRHAESGWPD